MTWHLLGFESEFRKEMTPWVLGALPLVVIRSGQKLRVFDAVCPHRGADLGRVGRLCDGYIECGFHHHRIHLGSVDDKRLSVAEHHAEMFGGILFVRLANAENRGFDADMARISASHRFFAGFRIRINASDRYILENAFDQSHFGPVHKVLDVQRFEVDETPERAFCVRSVFSLPASPWQTGASGAQGSVHVPFQATAYSPHLIVSEMGGDKPYCVITGADTEHDGFSTVRLAIGLPVASGTDQVLAKGAEYLIQQSRAGLEQDRVVWETLHHGAAQHLLPSDEPVARFHAFCSGFPHR